MNQILPCVVDASICVKLLLEEDYSLEVQELFACYLNDEKPSAFAVPDLAHIECTNILWKRVRQKTYSAIDARLGLKFLLRLALPTTPTAELIERALEISCIHDISGYDACYVALAEKFKLPLLTADVKLARQMDGSPHRIMLIQEYLDALLS